MISAIAIFIHETARPPARWAVWIAVIGCLLLGENGGRPVDASSDSPITEGRALWVAPRTVGFSGEQIREFLDQATRAGIQLCFLMLKDPQGTIFWQSERFADQMAPEVREFDFLAHFSEQAKARGLRVHGWICDFIESPTSPIVVAHPDWAMRNAQGETTTSEKLTDEEPYPHTWMCPARRPGYADTYLLPMLVEILTRYPVDGIHHDYLRYPGDVAPREYCFCDSCLDGFPRYANLPYDALPGSEFQREASSARPEAAGWHDLAWFPADWDRMSLRARVAYIREAPSASLTQEPEIPDLFALYFQYRADTIHRFLRDSWKTLERVRPELEISAATFKNAPLSQWFMGQAWQQFAPWVDIMVPMNYRSHFPGGFRDYVTLLEETVRQQRVWLDGSSLLYAGIATKYLYKEEDDRLSLLEKLAARWQSAGVASEAELRGAVETYDWLRQLSVESPDPRITSLPASLASLSQGLEDSDPEDSTSSSERVRQIIESLRHDPPVGLYPAEKLKDSVAAARAGGADGIALFSANDIARRKLWPTVEELFQQPAIAPSGNPPEGVLSVSSWKANRARIRSTQLGYERVLSDLERSRREDHASRKQERNLLWVALGSVGISLVAVLLTMLWAQSRRLKNDA